MISIYTGKTLCYKYLSLDFLLFESNINFKIVILSNQEYHIYKL